jgi:hypothetical protein
VLSSELLKSFTTKELMRWPGIETLYAPILRQSPIFAASSEGAKSKKGDDRWEALHKRVIEHVRRFSLSSAFLVFNVLNLTFTFPLFLYSFLALRHPPGFLPPHSFAFSSYPNLNSLLLPFSPSPLSLLFPNHQNIRVVSTYYTRITLPRLSQLLTLSALVVSKTVFARIDRPQGIVDFRKKKGSDEVLNDWSGDLEKMLGLIEKTSHLINKVSLCSVLLCSDEVGGGRMGGRAGGRRWVEVGGKERGKGEDMRSKDAEVEMYERSDLTPFRHLPFRDL